MDDPEEIARFHDRCSDLMRDLLKALACMPDQPRPFPEMRGCDRLATTADRQRARRRLASA